MNNWLGKTMFGIVGVFILAAFIGINRNQALKLTEMPAAIKYQIITYDNTWPDQFYSSSYTSLGTGFRLETYWTIEPSKHPLGIATWVYHSTPLIWENVNSRILEIKR